VRSGNIGRRSAARERLELYRARLYGGRAVSQGKLGELERASDGAAARLRDEHDGGLAGAVARSRLRASRLVGRGVLCAVARATPSIGRAAQCSRRA